MEESFFLLSSMSPKVNKSKRGPKKTSVPTKLALKKSMRRSSIYDRFEPTVRTKNAVLVDSSSSETSSGISLEKGKEVVYVIDSDDDKRIEDSPLSKAKIDSITNWIAKINAKETKDKNVTSESEVVNNDKNNHSIFSQVSSINGELRNKNGVVNSTFLENRNCFRIDEAFSKEKNKSDDSDDSFDLMVKKTFVGSKTNTDSKLSEGSIIEASYISKTSDEETENAVENVTKNVAENVTDNVAENVAENAAESAAVNSDLMNKFSETNVLKDKENVDTNNFVTPLKTKKNSTYEESLMDELYGNSWRVNKDTVRSVTKISKIIKSPLLHSKTAKKALTEKRPNLKKLHTPIQSPWTERLKNLIDSESEENIESDEDIERDEDIESDENIENDANIDTVKDKGLHSKVKLQFDDEASSSDSLNELGGSLYDRLNAKGIVKTPFKTPKNKKINKIETKSVPLPRKAYIISSDEEDEDAGKDYRDQRYEEFKDNDEGHKDRKGRKELEKRNDFKDRFKELKDFEVGTDPKVCGANETSKKSFLSSLSLDVPDKLADCSARLFRNNYKAYRDDLLKKLFSLYNEKIFNGCIPLDTPFEWNVRLRGTAGQCICRKTTHRTGKIERNVKIVLSTKVLDSADRLRDTLVHELCHAATWLVNKVSDGHGPYWKAWANKAMVTFPELPLISRCHDYKIETKFTYKCTGCGYSIGRHTKSLDLTRKRCGYCRGEFEVLINKKLKNGEKRTVPVSKNVNGFAAFVKENYGNFNSPQLKHADVMKVLGAKFKELKVDKRV